MPTLECFSVRLNCHAPPLPGCQIRWSSALWSTLIPSLNCLCSYMATTIPLIFHLTSLDTFSRAEHILQLDPVDTGVVGALHLHLFSVWGDHSLDSVLKSCCDSCPSTRGLKNPEAFPCVCQLDNLLSQLWMWQLVLFTQSHEYGCIDSCAQSQVNTFSHLYSFIAISCLAVLFSCFIAGILSP